LLGCACCCPAGLDIFLQAKPDVVILEVGIGGRIDATNIIKHTAVTGDNMQLLMLVFMVCTQWWCMLLVSCCCSTCCLEGAVTVATLRPACCLHKLMLLAQTHAGITSLGYDHMELLGDTLNLIAREKAGIMRPGVPCFTVEQLPEAMAALQVGRDGSCWWVVLAAVGRSVTDSCW
jgi:hypothetical protein